MKHDADRRRPGGRRRLMWFALLAFLIAFVLLGVLVILPILQQMTRNYEAETVIRPTPTAFAGTVSEETIAALGTRLREVGLTDAPVLFSTGVDEHLARVRRGEVSPEALLQYADNLAALSAATSAHGEQIPVAFWDSETDDMRANNLSVYDAVASMALPDSAPYLTLLAQSFNRLARLHQNPDPDNTALDAAFDIFLLVADYVELQYGTAATTERENVGRALITIWQQVMFSTSRNNPLNGQPLVSHGIFNHFNITSMWRYRIRENAGIGEIWGTSGFADRFVGDAANDNQVEHTTLSMMLQLVLGEPVTALNLIEDRDIITGRESLVHAQADISINSAISEEFAPRFARDWRTAIEHLRCVLHGQASCN